MTVVVAAPKMRQSWTVSRVSSTVNSVGLSIERDTFAQTMLPSIIPDSNTAGRVIPEKSSLDVAEESSPDVPNRSDIAEKSSSDIKV